MNPIDILYSWQALLVACGATALTQLTKVVIDIVRGHLHTTPTPTVRIAAKVGKDLRADNPVLNRLILPGLPVLYGIILALLVPARPDVVVEYVVTHHIVGFGANAIYASWGAACGQFADYLFMKAKGAMEVFARSGSSRRSTPPPPPPEEKDDNGEENAG